MWLRRKGEGAPRPLPPGSRAVSLTLPAHRGCTALPRSAEVACCPAQPHPPPPGLEAARFPDCTRDRVPSPGVVRYLLPRVVRGRVASSTLPKLARLTALPAGREVGVRQSGWGRAGAHARLLRPQVGEVGSGAARARGGCVGGTLHLCREGGVSTTSRVVHAGRHAGSCSHAMGEGRRFPLAPPLLVPPSGCARPH